MHWPLLVSFQNTSNNLSRQPSVKKWRQGNIWQRQYSQKILLWNSLVVRWNAWLAGHMTQQTSILEL